MYLLRKKSAAFSVSKDKHCPFGKRALKIICSEDIIVTQPGPPCKRPMASRRPGGAFSALFAPRAERSGVSVLESGARGDFPRVSGRFLPKAAPGGSVCCFPEKVSLHFFAIMRLSPS
jgi:hypothetical protein